MRVLIALGCFLAVARAAEICCASSGDCFTDDPPFDSPWRLPQCLEPIYRLYRQDIDPAGVEITRGTTPPEYVASDDTVYLVHGWQDFQPGWAEVAKDEFLATASLYNVIVVEWIEGASENITQAFSNVRTLGSEVADMNEQLGPAYSWCVGHSIGAHGCGHAGKFGAQWDRITGLDVTGPMFDLPSCSLRARTCRLHPSDAIQVDNIHTDAGGSFAAAGTFTLTGHMDFFPNGGVADQPGCENSTTIEACSHGYSIDLFIASINNDCFAVTQNCTDAENLPGSCGPCNPEGCPNMGASASNALGVFYIETTSDFQYCLGQKRI